MTTITDIKAALALMTLIFLSMRTANTRTLGRIAPGYRGRLAGNCAMREWRLV